MAAPPGRLPCTSGAQIEANLVERVGAEQVEALHLALNAYVEAFGADDAAARRARPTW